MNANTWKRIGWIVVMAVGASVVTSDDVGWGEYIGYGLLGLGFLVAAEKMWIVACGVSCASGRMPADFQFASRHVCGRSLMYQ